MSEFEELPFPPDDEPFEFRGKTRTSSYDAVHQSERVLLLRDQQPLPQKHAEDLAPQARDLEILRALWRYRFLLTSQIADEWWPGKTLYAAQRRLLRMTAAGWVTRFRPRLSKGKHEWIYQLDRKGFDLAKTSWGLDGAYIEEEAKWRTRQVREYSVVEHDLQVNAWVFAYRGLVGEKLIDWLGPDQGRIDVPTTYEPHKRRFRRVDLEDATLATDGHHHPRGLRLEQFGPLFPDATLTLYSDSIGAEVDLLIELDRTRRPTKNVDKLHRYDALLTAWSRMTDRYRHARVLPYVIANLGSRRTKDRLRAVEHLGASDTHEPIEYPVAAVGDRNTLVARSAAKALARLTHPAAAEALARLLTDTREWTRVMVADGLASRGDTRALPVLVNALNSPNVDVHGPAIEETIELLGSDAILALAEALVDNRVEPMSREVVAGVLGRMGDLALTRFRGHLGVPPLLRTPLISRRPT